jgi:kynureninase
VPYAEDGFRFMGATFDPSALYRFDAVMRWLDGLGIGAVQVHAHAHALQEAFIAALEKEGAAIVPGDLVLPLTERRRGNFLGFRRSDAAALQERLAVARIVTDSRGDVLRIGFGLYHAAEEMAEAAARVARALMD